MSTIKQGVESVRESNDGKSNGNQKVATSTVEPLKDSSNVETHKVRLKDVDEAAQLVAGFRGEITEEQSRRIRHKVDLSVVDVDIFLPSR